MALQFPTYTPYQPVSDLLSGIQVGMSLRERYDAARRAKQAEADLQNKEMAMALYRAQTGQGGMLSQALRGMVQQPVATTTPVATMPTQQAAAPFMPTAPVQAPKTIAPKQPIPPESTADTSA